MELRAVIPEKMLNDAPQFGLSPGLVANGLMYVSGQLGFDQNGHLSSDPTTQAQAALENLRLVLQQANCDFKDIVELTTYHVGQCSAAMQYFIPTKKDYFSAPYPAWTAVSVQSLAIDEAVIEIAAVVRVPRLGIFQKLSDFYNSIF